VVEVKLGPVILRVLAFLPSVPLHQGMTGLFIFHSPAIEPTHSPSDLQRCAIKHFSLNKDNVKCFIPEVFRGRIFFHLTRPCPSSLQPEPEVSLPVCYCTPTNPAYHLIYTVEPGYNDIGLCDTSHIASDI
jgi:hypothetical protein